MQAQRNQLERDGFTVLPGMFSPEEVGDRLGGLEEAFARSGNGVLRSSRAIYGARNVAQLWPGVVDAWRKAPLVDFARAVLGPGAGLVRVLFFDKSPEQSWTLPFHRDMTIAVMDNTVKVAGFSHPTRKAGVAHLEATEELLERMLILRIHLDPMTVDNGPLSLLPGSHRTDLAGPPEEAVTPLGPAGDVLAMRPLVMHGSRHTRPGNTEHRRILHLELAGVERPAHELEWHMFVPIRHGVASS
jgi:hypothetical protein